MCTDTISSVMVVYLFWIRAGIVINYGYRNSQNEKRKNGVYVIIKSLLYNKFR